MKIKFAPPVFALIAVLCTTCGYENLRGSGQSTVCDQRYALCTSAPCIPDPLDPDKAICFCDVAEGKSYGETSCENRKPHTSPQGVNYLTSTYSFSQYGTHKTLTCPDGAPWTFCLDMPCTVDPQDPTKAICSCKVLRSGSFITLGGDCDKSTCETAYWSGATNADKNKAMAFLMKAMGLTESPEHYCPE